MPRRLERGFQILNLLQDGSILDPSQLAAAMGVTRRTIFRDIAALRELGYDIEFDQDSSCYFYEPPESLGEFEAPLRGKESGEQPQRSGALDLRMEALGASDENGEVREDGSGGYRTQVKQPGPQDRSEPNPIEPNPVESNPVDLERIDRGTDPLGAEGEVRVSGPGWSLPEVVLRHLVHAISNGHSVRMTQRWVAPFQRSNSKQSEQTSQIPVAVVPVELVFGADGWVLNYRRRGLTTIESVLLENVQFQFSPSHQPGSVS